MVFWLTGLSGSGKTTLAGSLARYLRGKGFPTLFLDGDEARASLCADLGFSMEDRRENVRRIAACAALAEKSGIIASVACISPLAELRQMAAGLIDDFHEIYVSCPLEVCLSRDPKGNYKKARHGKLGAYTGISSPYEEPEIPRLVLHTERESLETSQNRLFAYASSVLPKSNF